MKKDLHPKEYRDVVFMDEAVGFSFLTKSTAQTDETIEHEGKTYPLVKIYISSKSHPFFTGEEKVIDTEGRIDRFAAKMKAAAEHKAKQAEKTAKSTVKKVDKNIDPVATKVKKAIDSASDAIQDTVEDVAAAAKDAAKKVEEKLDEKK